MEYKSVQRHSQDFERLKRLHRVRLDRQQATELVHLLCDEFGLRRPRLSFTGRTDRGWYWNDGTYRIVVRSSGISAEVLIHELAHHWVYTKISGADGSHGWDFTQRLDRLAEATFDHLPDIALYNHPLKEESA